MPTSKPSAIPRLIALLALLLTGPAIADCLYPEAPEVIPDGATASYEEMLEAQRIVSDFDADIRRFTVCIALQADELLASGELDEEELQILQAHLVTLNDAAVSEAEFVAEQFNQQLRIFRERNAP